MKKKLVRLITSFMITCFIVINFGSLSYAAACDHEWIEVYEEDVNSDSFIQQNGNSDTVIPKDMLIYNSKFKYFNSTGLWVFNSLYDYGGHCYNFHAGADGKLALNSGYFVDYKGFLALPSKHKPSVELGGLFCEGGSVVKFQKTSNVYILTGYKCSKCSAERKA